MRSARGSVPCLLSPWWDRFHRGPCCKNSRLARPAPKANEKLLRVELDDELLADREGDVLTRRQLVDRAAEVLLVEGDRLRHDTMFDRRECLVDAAHLLRDFLDLDNIARAHEVRRDVDLLAVYREVTVANELTRFGVIAREAHAVDHV